MLYTEYQRAQVFFFYKKLGFSITIKRENLCENNLSKEELISREPKESFKTQPQ